jgi:hypothetical protein
MSIVSQKRSGLTWAKARLRKYANVDLSLLLRFCDTRTWQLPYYVPCICIHE